MGTYVLCSGGLAMLEGIFAFRAIMVNNTTPGRVVKVKFFLNSESSKHSERVMNFIRVIYRETIFC